MIYGSVCSGIEAATVAWEPLGWKPAFFSEIDAFPRAVLAHHFPAVPLHGDFTTIGADDYGAIDLLVGGTPCQAFSVAGLRGGLSDERGNLALEFVAIANRKRPEFILWENVPGVLSSKDNAFGCFLAGLAGESVPLVAPRGKWPNAGWVVGPERTVAWRVLDAQYFGVAQRRRRVFVVASAGTADPREILFEREGLRRDFAPSRETREDIAKCLTRGIGSRYDSETDTFVAGTLGARTCRSIGAQDASCGHLIAFPINTQIALRHNALGERTGMGIGDPSSPAFTLQAGHSHAVAFGGNIARTLSARHDSSPCADRGMDIVAESLGVRRLTPTECERLQGFPDGWTAITYRGNPAADGPRYKALGNSMAVPCMRWIGERIQMVDNLIKNVSEER